MHYQLVIQQSLLKTQKLYDKPEMFVEGGVPKEYYEIPFGEGIHRSKGDDITLVTLGASLYRAMEAKEELENTYGLSVEVIDMRSAVPFNYEILIESVKKTGKIVFINEGFERSNFMKNVSQTLIELAFDHFDAPPVVLGARNWIMPGAEYEQFIYPQKDDILSAIHEKIMRLDGYVPTKVHTKADQIRKAKKGV